MLVVSKKVGDALWINGVTVGVVAINGRKVSLGIQSDDPDKRCELRFVAPMPQPKDASSPEQQRRANRDLSKPRSASS